MTTGDIPRLTAADITRIARRELGANADAALEILAELGTQSWHAEVHRVRAATLFLAKGDIDELRRLVRAACIDYRDVLMWAEYPSYDEGPTARKEDAERYRAWLAKA